ncbi:origin recognition complex subunit 3-like [Oppia nitens]|uniref:origin recognition complex subunit 3-like n=1 Tax=Oppia nitens TaxID=1686743 RepID=UPI0023DAE105|nr:origin recognition complex subunit 3-like [Oppia nitens]
MSSQSCESNICHYVRPKSKTPNCVKRQKKKKEEKINASFVVKHKSLITEWFNRFDEQITKVRDDMLSPLMNSLYNFVSNNCVTNEMRENNFDTKSSPSVGLIPTALLSIGMNSSEHHFICDLLIETIQDLTSSVAYINAKQNSTINSVFKTICDSILTEDVIKRADLTEIQLKSLTFESLFKIYEERVIKANTNNFCPPIVLFFDEIESFDHSMITTLILIIKDYIQKLPFILIISKSNETSSLQHLLPSKATDYLYVNHFQSICGQKLIVKIICKLFVDSSLSFKLGPNVLDFMLKMCQKFNSSIISLQNIIKYSVFKHFQTNELALLCQSISSLKTYLKDIELNELKVLRDKLNISYDLNDKEFIKEVINKLTHFQSVNNQIVLTLKIVLYLVDGHIDETKLVNFYITLFKDTYDFTDILDQLNRFSKERWNSLLSFCLNGNSLNDETNPMIAVLKLRLKELIQIKDKLDLEPTVVIEKMDLMNVKNKLTKFKTRSQWKDSIKPLNKQKVLSAFEMWRNVTIDTIKDTLSEIKNSIDNSFHQIMYFDCLDLIKNQIFVDQRSHLMQTLSDSKSSQTDLHRLYSLYNKNHSIINMYDMYNNFISFSNQSESSHKSPKKAKFIEKKNENIVRFLNSVSDFEYIGLIEPSKRKSDHLIRLVWF